MTLKQCVMNMEDNLAYLVYELSALTKFHIVNCVLNGILAGVSMTYGHFF